MRLTVNPEQHQASPGRSLNEAAMDEGVTRVKAFMAIVDDEPSVGKANARLGQCVEIIMKKVQRLHSMTDGEEMKHVLDYTHVDLYYVEDQRKNLLSKGRGKRKDEISLKEVVFTKENKSPSETAPEITFNSESKFDNQEPLPPILILSGAEPIGTSNNVISLVDLTLTLVVLKKTKKVTNKVSSINFTKKKTQTKSPYVPNLCLDKKADLSSEKLLLTLMERYKVLNRKSKLLYNSLSVSQSGSSKSTKVKQKTWFGPCKHYGFINHLPEDCYMKPKCSTCGSTDHLTKEHSEQAVVKKTLAKLKAHSSQGSSSKKAPMIPKTFIECKYYEFNDHHSDKFNQGLLIGDLLNSLKSRHGKTTYDVFRGRSFDISYFHMFGYPMHIHNQRDHLGKFNEKVNDGFFLGYSLVTKAFRVFNIRRQEMEETDHVTFSKDDEAITKSSIEGDAINFNENRSFSDDEFLIPRSKVSQSSGKDDYFPYVHAYDPLSTNNITIPDHVTPTNTPTL
nr:retrovirus-related Pol polyprotein from transposon TNT 1-94 [Tanacetum cinerariifolium]